MQSTPFQIKNKYLFKANCITNFIPNRTGYIAGVFCAIVSHPADTVVSKLNQAKGASALDVAKRLGWSGMPIHSFFYHLCPFQFLNH